MPLIFVVLLKKAQNSSYKNFIINNENDEMFK